MRIRCSAMADLKRGSVPGRTGDLHVRDLGSEASTGPERLWLEKSACSIKPDGRPYQLAPELALRDIQFSVGGVTPLAPIKPLLGAIERGRRASAQFC